MDNPFIEEYGRVEDIWNQKPDIGTFTAGSKMRIVLNNGHSVTAGIVRSFMAKGMGMLCVLGENKTLSGTRFFIPISQENLLSHIRSWEPAISHVVDWNVE